MYQHHWYWCSFNTLAYFSNFEENLWIIFIGFIFFKENIYPHLNNDKKIFNLKFCSIYNITDCFSSKLNRNKHTDQYFLLPFVKFKLLIKLNIKRTGFWGNTVGGTSIQIIITFNQQIRTWIINIIIYLESINTYYYYHQ